MSETTHVSRQVTPPVLKTPPLTINPLEFDLFAGLDVDKRSIVVTYVDHANVLQSRKLPYDAHNLLTYTRKQFSDKRVAFVYEAGPTGYGLYDALTAAQVTCLVTPPSQVPVARGTRVKTNRVDSQRLAEGLRGAELHGVRVPTGAYRELRHLTRLRNQYIEEVRATKCRIKALLLHEGLIFPEAPPGSQWSQKIVRQLRAMEASPAVRFRLHSLLDTLQFIQRQALTTQEEVRRLCSEDAEIAASIGFLMSIPGIGWIIASNLMARIGDHRNLKNGRELGGFLGLTPCEDSTGDDVRRGSITHSGDATLRNMLIEGAWTAIRKDPDLAEFYRRICQRHPRDRAARIAIVAVARKLTTRMHTVLTQRRDYVPSQTKSQDK